jgi:hypothetical protein
MPTKSLYETDFYVWIQTQADLLREEEFEELDLPNLIEELEAMGRSERRELVSRLTVLLTHLLKWQYQPDMRSKSWQNTIRIQRRDIQRVLSDSPSLRATLAEFIALAYPDARMDAVEETGLLSPVFPEACPYSAEQILNVAFLPD